MDGNRRWAKKQWKLAFFGHQIWFKNAENIIEVAHKKWIEYITLWAMSKENLEKRDIDEINGLIQIINTFVEFIPKFQKNNIKFETIGDISKLPQKTQDILENIKYETRNNSSMTVIVALVYSGQDEIIRAAQKILDAKKEKIWDEKEFRKYLDTGRFPEVDLIIRTWWDLRHSWFCLYDSAYSEYYFTQTFWPDFDEKELDKALNQFYKVERRFGK